MHIKIAFTIFAKKKNNKYKLIILKLFLPYFTEIMFYPMIFLIIKLKTYFDVTRNMTKYLLLV